MRIDELSDETATGAFESPVPIVVILPVAALMLTVFASSSSPMIAPMIVLPFGVQKNAPGPESKEFFGCVQCVSCVAVELLCVVGSTVQICAFIESPLPIKD